MTPVLIYIHSGVGFRRLFLMPWVNLTAVKSRRDLTPVLIYIHQRDSSGGTVPGSYYQLLLTSMPCRLA